MVERSVARSRRRMIPYLVAALLLGAPTVGRAANDAARQAKAAFEQGDIAYKLGQWDQAIEAWERGFRLKPDPVFLYNLAQAHRKAGHGDRAIFFYKSYLRDVANVPNRDEVLGWIDQLERDIAAERQRKADAEQRRADEERRAEEQRRHDEAEAQRRAADAAAVVAHANAKLRGDVGLRAGVNLWAAGLSTSRSPSAAVELGGGYTLVEKGRLRFRLGATFAFTYLRDLDKTVNLFGLLIDPTLKVDLWRQKLFFFVEVGLGAALVAGMAKNQASALLHGGKASDGGVFAAFEARPAVGIEYVPIRRLSVLLAPGAAISTPPTHDFSTLVRVQILAGVSVHL